MDRLLELVRRPVNTNRLSKVLSEHWLFDLGQMEPICSCFVELGKYASVELAVQAWVRHVIEHLDG